MSTTTIIYSFNNDKAKEKVAAIIKNGGQLGGIIPPDSLAEDFDDILDNLRASYKNDAYQGEFLNHFKEFYLLLGSSQACIVNSPVGEFQHMQEIEHIVSYYSVLTIDTSIPTKAGFRDIYEKINPSDIEDIARKFSKDCDYDYPEGKEEIINTLQYLKPLVKDLKEDHDSLLIVMHDYNSPELLPSESDKLIDEQIKEIIEKYKDDINFRKFLGDK